MTPGFLGGYGNTRALGGAARQKGKAQGDGTTATSGLRGGFAREGLAQGEFARRERKGEGWKRRGKFQNGRNPQECRKLWYEAVLPSSPACSFFILLSPPVSAADAGSAFR